MRQFVFVPPNHFVVCDRVTSTQAEFQKRWLLHTAREPRLEGKMFSAVQGEGRILCRTIFPEDATLVAIGGPGKEFWTDGRNWPLPQRWRRPRNMELMGKWRVEVSPGAARKTDVFVHLIEVGDGAAINEMAGCTRIQTDTHVGVGFSIGDRAVDVTFAKEGGIAGHIRITEGEQILDRDFVTRVQKQAMFDLGVPPVE